MSLKVACIVGANGLIGNALLAEILNDAYYDQVKVIVRKSLNQTHDKIEEIVVPNFNALDNYIQLLDAHDYFITLGTTIHKAGTKENFLKVDVEYPLQLAKIIMMQPHYQQLAVVTALGSNSKSRIFYNRAKGNLEKELIRLNLKSLIIFQPSLLIGKRKEFRMKEEIAKSLLVFLSVVCFRSKYIPWSIKAKEVAIAMLKVVKKNQPGFKRIKPKEMINIVYS